MEFEQINARRLYKKMWAGDVRPDGIRGIGGSDIGAICNVSPHSSPFQLYQKKLGLLKTEMSSFMEWGARLETPIADKFAENHIELEMVESPYIFQHISEDWALANIDRLLMEQDDCFILECKTANQFLKSSYLEGIPDNYYLQVQWYLWVLDLQKAWLAVLIGGNDYREFEIERNNEIIAMAVNLARTFWFENVLKHQAPEVSAKDIETLNDFYSENENFEEVEIAQDISQVIADFRQAQEKVKYWEDIKAKSQAQLIQASNGATSAKYNNFKLSYTTVQTERFDTKAFEAENQELYTKYLKQSSYKRFSLKERK